MLEVHRTHRAKILNHTQVEESLDRHGWSVSKLWNVANYHSRQVWEDTGEIPDHGDLKDELKATTSTRDYIASPVSAFWRSSLKPSTRGMVRESPMIERIRPATASKTTTTNRTVASTKNTRAVR